jgi:hypothetical protein
MTTAAKFWNWFKEHNEPYLLVDDLEDDVKETLFDDLLEQLHLYCAHLYFEIGGLPGEEQELIITAEGNVDYFEQVELLIANAPVIQGWTFIAFIPQRNPPVNTLYEDVELIPTKMWFMPLNSTSKPKSIGIKVCLRDYEVVKDNKWLKPAVYKLLDTILGEKVFALDIDFVDFGDLPEDPAKEGMIELVDLPRFVVWKNKQMSN